MIVKAGNTIKPGEMVTMKPTDYKAPHPTGDYEAFCLKKHDRPIGVAIVVDDRIPEGELRVVTSGHYPEVLK